MTDFKVGDRVRAIRESVAPHTQDKLPAGYETDVLGCLPNETTQDGQWVKLATPIGYDGPERLHFRAEDFELVRPPAALLASLDIAHTVIDELHGDIERANTLVGALEQLLAATQDQARQTRYLNAADAKLVDAETHYRKARDDFDRASSESDTNGGESS